MVVPTVIKNELSDSVHCDSSFKLCTVHALSPVHLFCQCDIIRVFVHIISVYSRSELPAAVGADIQRGRFVV